MSGQSKKPTERKILRLHSRDGAPVAAPEIPPPGELDARLTRELNAALSAGQPGQLLVFRIGNFELLVDTFGAEFGAAAEDALLKQLRGKLRKREPVQRLKAGEFVIVGRSIQSLNALQAMAARMVEGGSGHYEIEGVPCRLNIAIGAAAFPQDSKDPEELLQYARFALGDAESEETNQLHSFSADRLAEQKAAFIIEAEMEAALAEGRFKLQYQPQFTIGSRRISGVEALARLRTRDGRSIPPDEFIPVAESNGFIVQLGRWVIQEACRQLGEWRRNGVDIPRVSINLSPRQLTDPDLLGIFENAVSDNDLRYGNIEVEITERCIVEESRVTTELLHALRARGIRIAIDDFGTGYSSFAYLAWQPLDMVKLDRSFLARAAGEMRIGAVISGMISMAKDLGMDVIAEGVETDQQARFLQEHGCEYAQGFALARPQDPDRIPELFTSAQGRAQQVSLTRAD